jgi:hypothetical protein
MKLVSRSEITDLQQIPNSGSSNHEQLGGFDRSALVRFLVGSVAETPIGAASRRRDGGAAAMKASIALGRETGVSFWTAAAVSVEEFDKIVAEM